MDKLFVRDLVDGQLVDSSFVVRQLERRQKKDGQPFLRLVLADRTGEVRAVMWDGVSQALKEVSQGDYAHVTGSVGTYQDQPQLKVDRIRRLDPSEVDEGDFISSTSQDIDLMWKALTEAVALIKQPKLRELLEEILGDGDFAERFRRCPAAKRYHHTFRGGLLEHTLSLVRLCTAVAVEELRFDRDYDYTDEGQLVGHLVMAAADLDARMRRLDFDDKLRAEVLHLIVSHHGEEQYGSPKKPMTPEAIALHYLDMLDSRIEMARAALEADEDRDGSFTQWVRSLERPLYKG